MKASSQGDTELIGYVQRIVGLAAIGQAFVEALVIAYGDGRNGKSTLWNTIARVLGTYAGNMSADVLTIGEMRNVKPGPTPEKWTRRGSGPKIDGNSDIKNYADYLCKEAGAVILA